MPTRRTAWPGKEGAEDALFRPRVERAWCSFETVRWLSERAAVDVAIPGMKAGDIQGGPRIVGSWEGLMLEDRELRPGIVLATRTKRTSGKTIMYEAVFHVRLEEGFVHEGHPDQCDDGTCLAERVMGS